MEASFINLVIFVSDLVLVLHERLNTGGLSNEVISEGCVKWGKVRMSGGELTTLVLTLVMSFSVMKMNLCRKIGSAIPKSSVQKYDFGTKRNVRGVYESVYLKITNMVNTNTGEHLNDVHDFPKANNIKRGNLGKNIRLNLNTVLFKIFRFNSKDTILYSYFYSIKLLNLVIYNLPYSKILFSEYRRVYGGKIREKANALSNVKDTTKQKKVSFPRRSITWPRFKHIGEKLNSLGLRKNALNNRGYHSSVRDESIKLVKRQLKESNMLEWPDSKKLGIIRKDVFKQQLSLVRLAETYGLHSNALFKKQKTLLNSLFFRIVAIDKLSKSEGSRTSGIDGIRITNKKNPNLYLDLLQSIRHEAKNPYNYKASPIKRAWIPKGKNSLRPLGIPTLKDRALQHLVNLILEPLVEMTSEPHSFGFRPYRSAKQAIAYLRSNLRTRNLNSVKKRTSKSNIQNELFELLPENKVILDADIKGFFDNINHDWILNNLFLHPDLITLIKAWLKSSGVDKDIFSETRSGILQSGIISPTLANFTLNGLEPTIMNSITLITKSKEKRISIHLKDESRIRIASGLAYVRYADDFVVLARSKHLISEYVLPSIKHFLEIRGLALSKEKTKIFRLCDKNAQLDFLGYTFKYQDKWSTKSSVFHSQHAGSKGIALYPNKKKVFEVIQCIKFIFKVSKNLDAYNLIAKLNPVIRGWSNYFNMANSLHYRDTVRNAIYRLTWKWACRKHKRWGRKLIADNYFLRKISSTSDVHYKKVSCLKFKNRKWVFHSTVNKKSRYNTGKNKTIYLVDVGNISQLLPSKYYILPKKYLTIHGYHLEYMKLVTHSTNVNFKTGGIYSSFKERLLKKQNNFCAHCKEPLVNSESLYGNQNLHIHHLEPIYRGGSRNSTSNMVLLHSWCHYDTDHKDLGA